MFNSHLHNNDCLASTSTDMASTEFFAEIPLHSEMQKAFKKDDDNQVSSGGDGEAVNSFAPPKVEYS